MYITHWILALIDSLHEEHWRAHEITLDAYAASHRTVREMKEDGELPGRVKVRSSQYLNNLVEQDHRIRNHLQGGTSPISPSA